MSRTNSLDKERTVPITSSLPLVSVVIIGRNEGMRLQACLRSIRRADWHGVPHECIYVDSRSSDGSALAAAEHGATVLVLEDDKPCAAKARNLGWRAARGHHVLFLDGDTELDAAFVQRSLQALRDERLCAVWGHRREARPAQSVYTRVLDLDWIYPTGRTLYFGGDVLVRRSALEAASGFDESLNAGEEPELCARLRALGWEIEHIDAPMTRHDLAINTFRAYWLRAYRSGIAYAEVTDRMRRRGEALWQHEARRDFRHAIVFMLSLPALVAALWAAPALALLLAAAGAALLARTAWRCSWKAPGQWMLCLQYAAHSHLQKVPALFGQLAFRRAARRRATLGSVNYKDGSAGRRGLDNAHRGKALLARMLAPLAWLDRIIVQRALRVWHLARLQQGTGRAVDASNVILGPVELHGSRNIRFGKDALIYPGVYLETQGGGEIEIGNRVVLSRGVHIVAFERVVLGEGSMVGEYASIRDANHVHDLSPIRESGHASAPISIGRHAWLGRGVSVLRGAAVGEHVVVGANAVVTRPVPARQVVGGIPARALHAAEPSRTPSPDPA